MQLANVTAEVDEIGAPAPTHVLPRFHLLNLKTNYLTYTMLSTYQGDTIYVCKSLARFINLITVHM